MEDDTRSLNSPELPSGAYTLLSDEQLGQMVTPPEAFSGDLALTLVAWEWWRQEEPGQQRQLDVVELSPLEAGISSVPKTALQRTSIDHLFAPTRVSVLMFSELTDEGGAELDSIVFEATCLTMADDCDGFVVAVDESSTVVTVPIESMPSDVSMAVFQAEWQLETFVSGQPLVQSTWASYVDASE